MFFARESLRDLPLLLDGDADRAIVFAIGAARLRVPPLIATNGVDAHAGGSKDMPRRCAAIISARCRCCFCLSICAICRDAIAATVCSSPRGAGSEVCDII